MNDDFYIGWADRAPRGLRTWIQWVVLSTGGVVVGLAIALASDQRTIGRSVFEWGNVKQFSGVIESWPYAHLRVARPKTSGESDTFSRYPLVRPFKFGLSSNVIDQFAGREVNLKGTLIYRENQTMLEVLEETIQTEPAAAKGSSSSKTGHSDATIKEKPAGATSVGTWTLQGEIVDSKCHYGVMNPGRFEPHRACAVRCISGGIPPILVTQDAQGHELQLLLVSAEGAAVNKEVLDWVARPVQITGMVERYDTLWILKADPKTYRKPSETAQTSTPP